MLLDFEEQVMKHGLRVHGVLHIGAHLAEEAPIYDRLGVPTLWVEANEDLRDKILWVLKDYPDQHLFARMQPVTSEDGEQVIFNITNYDSMSSSVFEFGTHQQFSPDCVFLDHRMMTTQTIDTIVRQYYMESPPPNTLVMDIQGAELLALKGAPEYLPYVDIIYTEVNTDEVYVGCAQLDDLAQFLNERGFVLIAEHEVPGQGWGDALFVRATVL